MSHSARKVGLAGALLLALALAPVLPVGAGTPVLPAEHPIRSALGWLATQQGADGGFANPGTTCDVVFALASAGHNPAAWRPTPLGPSAMDYLASRAAAYATGAAQTGKLIVAVAAAGLDPEDFGGLDLLAHLQSFGDGTGAYGAGAMDQAWALLGLLAAGQKVTEAERAILRAYQQANDGWEGAPGWGTDTNTTALAVQALLAAGDPPTSKAVQAARAHLLEQQNDDGGFPYTKPSPWGSDSDANSTAYVLQALLAMGEDPTAEPWSRGPGRDPVAALLRFQVASGAFEWQPGFGENLLATAQAIPALAGKALPLTAGQWPAAEVLIPAPRLGPALEVARGNLVTCVAPPPALSWIKAYRLTAEGTWEDVNPRGWTSVRGDGYLKVDGLPVDYATFGGVGNPYRVELWVNGQVVRSAGIFHQGQPAFRIRPEADSVTPWPCPVTVH